VEHDDAKQQNDDHSPHDLHPDALAAADVVDAMARRVGGQLGQRLDHLDRRRPADSRSFGQKRKPHNFPFTKGDVKNRNCL